MAALKVSDRVVVVSTGTYAGQVGVIVGLESGAVPMASVALDECTGDRVLPVRDLRPARQDPPIAASGIWSQVIDRAGGRCQCPAKHHRSHRRTRCEADTGTALLIAAPAVPGPNPDRTAARGVAELIAWCPSCWDEAERDANRQARAAERIARRTGELAGALW
jgi:hypothetical protein